MKKHSALEIAYNVISIIFAVLYEMYLLFKEPVIIVLQETVQALKRALYS